MRHHIVARIVYALTAVWALAIAFFAWGVTRPVGARVEPPAAPPGPDGAALFSQHCAMCHEDGDVGGAYRQAANRELALEEFREFLSDHFGPSPEGSAAIVKHLME